MADIFLDIHGCDKNRIDTEILAQKLIDVSHVIVDELSLADLVIVSTCAFITAAVSECISSILEYAEIKNDPNTKLSRIIITGCMPERYRLQVESEIPEADGIIGIGCNNDIVEVVERILAGTRVAAFDDPTKLPINGRRYISTPKHYAYLKIAEGCSNFCSYCIIPFIRGRYRSREVDDIIKEARLLVESGVKELILIAQDSSYYGSDLDENVNLADLLKELVKIEGLWKIRLLYTYSDHISDDLIQVMQTEPKIAKYIDIPFQHASDEILKNMNRRTTNADYQSLIEKLRLSMPDIIIRSSFIVGFPGETNSHFGELMNFIVTSRLSRVGCFCYSREEGSVASRMKHQIPDDIKLNRQQILMTTQTAILSEQQNLMIGKQLEVIVDYYDSERGSYCCRSEYDAPDIDTVVYLSSTNHIDIGSVVTVIINDTDGIDLFGEQSY
ncbi:MAG: 30S ribosomal protein S12 methylthiotransferase RimO [Oscillospiraceae bacterium]|nr:30S ribosomal protein S12 methylthiotransferase RimO [Oscillospiraceae bacterium]